MNRSHSSSTHPLADVRMKGFAQRVTVEAAWQWLDLHSSPLASESIASESAAGRVLATSITSRVDVPTYVRAMMDGFAVRACDINGASPYHPITLRIVDESFPGRPAQRGISAGEAIRIMTGAPIPQGADVVLPAEFAQIADQQVDALTTLPSGKHLGEIGEDVRVGEEILQAGRRLRPQDIGLLAAIGHDMVEVVRAPRVEIVVTGNELVSHGVDPHTWQIRDANGPMLEALATRDGASVRRGPLVVDRVDALEPRLLVDADVILISGGSSVGLEDHAPPLVAKLGTLAVHGIAMRPSSPAGLGTIGQRLVCLLPGNPVSCLCAYDFFAGRAIRRLGGRSGDWPYARRHWPLTKKLVSQIGRVDYVRVRCEGNRVEPIGTSGASLLSSTTRADGFVIVPADCEGYPPETCVEVFLYDEHR